MHTCQSTKNCIFLLYMVPNHSHIWIITGDSKGRRRSPAPILGWVPFGPHFSFTHPYKIDVITESVSCRPTCKLLHELSLLASIVLLLPTTVQKMYFSKSSALYKVTGTCKQRAFTALGSLLLGIGRNLRRGRLL